MHLRHSDTLCDLRLVHVLEKAKHQYCSFSFGQRRDQGTHGLDIEHSVEVGIEAAHRLVPGFSIVVRSGRNISRIRRIGVGGDESLHDLFTVHSEMVGQFSGGWCATQRMRQSALPALMCKLRSLSRRGTVTDQP